MTDAATAPHQDAVGPNPYVGPRSLRAGEALHGRERELANLRDTVIAERIVLLYSPSGAGKSSLLESGLRPELEGLGFRVAPTIRISHHNPADTGNRYVSSVLASLDADDNAAPGTDLSAALDAALGLSAEQGELCLFFDQFEEVFTLDPVDRDAKVAFFQQLGDLLREHDVWAVLAMREDYIAQLDPYLQYVPRRLSARFRLDFLGPEAAAESIRRPAGAAGVGFTDEGLGRLLDDLRDVRSERGGELVHELGPYIEPVQLQVVCRQLWSQLPAGTTSITADQIASLADTDDALGRFYDDQISQVAASTGTPERRIRDWFETTLITPMGLRAQASSFAGEHGAEVLRQLENAYLIRADRRRGVTWYELTHDRMVVPVQENNAAWMAAQLAPFQQLAARWATAGEPESLLVSADALAEAEAWASTHDELLSTADRQYLAAAREAEDERLLEAERARLDAERTRRQRTILAAALAVALVTLIASILAFRNASAQRSRADEAARQAQASDLLARSRSENDPYAGLLLALEAQYWAERPPADALEGWTAASVRLAEQPVDLVTAAIAGQKETQDIAWAPDGSRFVAANDDGSIRFFDREGAPLGERIEVVPDNQEISSIAWSPDGSRLLAAGGDGMVRLLDATSGASIAAPILIDEGSARGVAWNEDGTRFVVGGRSAGIVALYDAAGTAIGEPIDPDMGQTRDVAWSPGGRFIAVAGADEAASILDASGTVVQTIEVGPGSSWSVAWNADESRFVIATDRHSARIFDTDGQEVARPIDIGRGSVFAADWSRRQDLIALTGADGLLRLVDGTGKLLAPPVWTGSESSRAVAWSPTELRLAVGNDDGTIRVFDASPLADNRLIPLDEFTNAEGKTSDEEVTSVAWSSTGTVAFGTSGRSLVHLVDPDSRQVVATLEPTIPDVERLEIARLAFSRNGDFIAAVYKGRSKRRAPGWVQIFDVATASPRGEAFQTSPSRSLWVSWSPDSDRIVVANGIEEPNASHAQVYGLDGSPIGPALPSGAPGNKSEAKAAEWSPDGTRIAVGSDDGTVTLFSPDGARLAGPFETGEAGVNSLAWSVDSRLLLVGNEDGHTRGFDPDGRETGLDIVVGTDKVGDAAVSDRGTIAIANDDGTAAVAEPDGRLIVKPFETGPGKTVALAWNSDGTRLAIANEEAASILAAWTESDACRLLHRVFTVEQMEDIVGQSGARSRCAVDPDFTIGQGEPITILRHLE